MLRQGALFLIAFAVLQGLWHASRGTGVERFAVDFMTVKSATAFINVLTPTVGALAAGSRIGAPGGGITISNGCEGTEALFLLMAAIIACPFAWRVRLLGALCGALLIFALNQIRILVLFYAYRYDQAWFNQLHHTIAPLFLIAAASLFFLAWTTHHASRIDHAVADI